MTPDQDSDLGSIVTNGLCIGCGLCQSLAGPDRLDMVMTPEGRLRPLVREPLDPETVAQIHVVCPGTRIEGLPEDLVAEGATVDPLWGPHLRIVRGWAGDPDVRFRAATGGVLTSLALYLLESGRVDFVLHVAASQEQPMRSQRQVSFDRAQVLDGMGSRYGPAAPLIDVTELLAREQPFAFVGKPCDVGALRNLARLDPRVDRYCKYLLTLVCGGASELGKSQRVLRDLGVAEDELSLFRYRGHGNPGPLRVETKDGRGFEVSYQEMWEDEGTWQLQFRCKICPDAIGESADLAALDVWPDASPVGDDEGFNGIIVRTERGLELFEAALRDGALVVDETYTPRDLDGFQPHQVRKKRAVWARMAGLTRAGQPVPDVRRLRIRDLAEAAGLSANLREARGTVQRARDGRTKEPPPRPE